MFACVKTSICDVSNKDICIEDYNPSRGLRIRLPYKVHLSFLPVWGYLFISWYQNFYVSSVAALSIMQDTTVKQNYLLASIFVNL